MLTAGCVIKEVRVSTRMIYKKDWCGDGQDKYTNSALVSMDILLGSCGREPVAGKLRAVITSVEAPEEKTVSERNLVITQGESLWKLSMTVPSVRLWHTWDMGTPSLYDLKLEFADARYQERIGMKEVAYDGKLGILTLNRKRMFLRGVAADADLDLEAVKEAGANAVIVREALPQEMYSQCDELGLMVWRAYELPEAALTDAGISECLECIQKDAYGIMNHASHGVWSVELSDALCKAADRENIHMAYANAVFETVRSADPAKEVILENKAAKRAQAIFTQERIRDVDPRTLKLPKLVPMAGLETCDAGAEQKALEKWEVEYLRIRKYDPVSVVFARHAEAVKDGSLKPVLVAFEPGYESGPNGEGALIEAGKSFTSRIWAINDLHSRIDDVRLFWKIEEEQSGQVRAGNCFRLHLNPDSAEIPDHAIFVTNEEDKGKTFLMTAIIDTDECELTQNCMKIKVV